jgi:hypothetical protein
MSGITVQIIGLERLQAGVSAGPATLAAEVRTAMTAGSLLIEGTARSLAPKDTGRLAGSITHAITGGGANLTSRIAPSVNYGLWAEKGRGPGKPPPVAAIAPWARRHGMDPYILARSIGRKGTRGKPFMRPAFDSNVSRVISLFAKVGEITVRRMAG